MTEVSAGGRITGEALHGKIEVGFCRAERIGTAGPYALVGRADPYPWCAQYSGGARGGGRNCGFVAFEQCMATVSGVGGFCERNLFYTGPVKHPRRERKRRHHD